MHVSFVKFVREGLNIENIGPMPPPVMLLSDGGHVENLAILPLLKKKLKKIIVVDGGYYSNEKKYGKDLLKALMLARRDLNCSFIGQGGRDVISDLLENFVRLQQPDEKKTTTFQVRVYDLFRNLLPSLLCRRAPTIRDLQTLDYPQAGKAPVFRAEGGGSEIFILR